MSAIKPGQLLTIQVNDREDMEFELDNAVSALREQAVRERRCGILVTRHGVDRFTVALSESVPFGLTLEKHDW
ncbi:MAG: hypothetical protein NVS2B15_16950 [Pseudarthrobacter sp.]